MQCSIGQTNRKIDRQIIKTLKKLDAIAINGEIGAIDPASSCQIHDLAELQQFSQLIIL
ncbi:MAG: hypothetical protein MUE44_17510 [Oscillatoriaceae cyanobacterium Prado104]|nr:hypothetical protein [Oscillatoriaceae cyanobacterium Prado104]